MKPLTERQEKILVAMLNDSNRPEYGMTGNDLGYALGFDTGSDRSAPDVPTNAASFVLGASTRLIVQDGRWDVLVTYADEWQGHTGAIYRAAGWDYVGLTKPEPTYTLNGRMIARKAGPTTRTHAQMIELGAVLVGSFAKHKFVKRLR